MSLWIKGTYISSSFSSSSSSLYFHEATRLSPHWWAATTAQADVQNQKHSKMMASLGKLFHIHIQTAADSLAET